MSGHEYSSVRKRSVQSAKAIARSRTGCRLDTPYIVLSVKGVETNIHMVWKTVINETLVHLYAERYSVRPHQPHCVPTGCVYYQTIPRSITPSTMPVFQSTNHEAEAATPKRTDAFPNDHVPAEDADQVVTRGITASDPTATKSSTSGKPTRVPGAHSRSTTSADTDCPDCGGATMNGAGLFTCLSCSWVGPLE